MAISQDGSQGFAITATQLVSPTGTFVVESFSRSKTSNRVDLDNSDGEPLGSATIPTREEVSFTVQVGSGNTVPEVGDETVYDSVTYVMTEVEITESQADYQRLSISGYKKINN